MKRTNYWIFIIYTIKSHQRIIVFFQRNLRYEKQKTFPKKKERFFTVEILTYASTDNARSAVENFGNGIQNFIVAAAATRGTMRNFLYVTELFFHVPEPGMIVQRAFYIRYAYVFAMTDFRIFV